MKKTARFGYHSCMLTPADLFTDSELSRSLFFGTEHVWEALGNIGRCICSRIHPNVENIPRAGPVVTGDCTLDNGAAVHGGAFIVGDDIEIGPGAVVEPGAYIRGPAIIGPGTEVRHGAYVRGNVITGAGCVIGHTTEVKNSALLGDSKAGHFAYIGDSILGAVNLGAGTKLANLKLMDSEIVVRIGGETYNTGLVKFGAIMGDGCSTGCNSTTAPGTIMARNVLVYPNANARGFYGPGTIIKLLQNIDIRS